MEGEPAYCANCGKPMILKRATKKFCSLKCQQANYYLRKTKLLRKPRK